MKRKFFKRWMVVGFILIFQVPFLSSADDTISPNILKAAQEGIKTFIKGSKITDLYAFGFSSQEEVNAATLGKGLQIYTVHPASLLQEGASQKLDSLAVSTNLWRFIIVADGKAKALLDVDLMNGEWTPVGIGGVGLAKEISKALETWPASAGYQCKFIRVYQAVSDFLGVSLKENAVGILPFTSARMSMGLKERGFDPLELYDAGDVAARIRPIVKRNMGN